MDDATAPAIPDPAPRPSRKRKARHPPDHWRVQILPAGRNRKAEAIFATNGPERVGYFPTPRAAQDECDRRNAATVPTTPASEISA